MSKQLFYKQRLAVADFIYEVANDMGGFILLGFGLILLMCTFIVGTPLALLMLFHPITSAGITTAILGGVGVGGILATLALFALDRFLDV